MSAGNVYDHEYLTRKHNASPIMQAIMDLAYATGLRLGDLLHIHLHQPSPSDDTQVWLSDDALYVKPHKTKRRRPATIRFSRKGVLGTVINRILKLNAERQVSGLYLIVNRRGNSYTEDGFATLWQRLAANDDIVDFRFHDIRAKSATDAEEQGVNPQLLLGHADPKTTERYLRSKRVHDVQGPQSTIINSSPRDPKEIVTEYRKRPIKPLK